MNVQKLLLGTAVLMSWLSCVASRSAFADSAEQSAPQNVPLPTAEHQWLKHYPPSGSGLRVQLDDRHWVELVANGTTGREPIYWTADGELIDAPANFDALTLVPEPQSGPLERLEANRQSLIQLVVPQGVEVTVRASGGGAVRTVEMPINDVFKQVVVQCLMHHIRDNFAHIDVSLTTGNWQSIAVSEPGDTDQNLEKRDHRWIEFQNISVYPGPRTAPQILVDGGLVSDAGAEAAAPSAANAVEIPSTESVSNPTADDRSDGDEIVMVRGKVVDADGRPLFDMWVGMFAANDERVGHFRPRYRLVAETRSGPDGAFSFETKRGAGWFEGVFWTVDELGTSGMKPLNATWSHINQNLRIEVSEAQAEIKVTGADGEPVAGASVTPESLQLRRSVDYSVPPEVAERLKLTTDGAGRAVLPGWPVESIRGVAVTTPQAGTQYLAPGRVRPWAEKGEPLMLALKPTGRVLGQVIGFDPSRDPGLQLLASTEQFGDSDLRGRAVADVRDDGSFEFDRLAVGSVRWESSLQPNSRIKLDLPWAKEIEAGQTLAIELPMVPATVVRQRLIKRDTGEALAGMTLRVLWGRAVDGPQYGWGQSISLVTDQSGWWSAPVLPGKINIRISSVPEGYEGTAWFDGRNGYLGVEACVPTSDEIVTLPPEAYVPAKRMSGRLLHADGSPAAGWGVYGHPVSWNDVGVGGVRTGQDGTFSWTYPTGYPPRLFEASNRVWQTAYHFEDEKLRPQVISRDPLVLQLPAAP